MPQRRRFSHAHRHRPPRSCCSLAQRSGTTIGRPLASSPASRPFVGTAGTLLRGSSMAAAAGTFDNVNVKQASELLKEGQRYVDVRQAREVHLHGLTSALMSICKCSYIASQVREAQMRHQGCIAVATCLSVEARGKTDSSCTLRLLRAPALLQDGRGVCCWARSGRRTCAGADQARRHDGSKPCVLEAGAECIAAGTSRHGCQCRPCLQALQVPSATSLVECTVLGDPHRLHCTASCCRLLCCTAACLLVAPRALPAQPARSAHACWAAG